MFAMKNILKYFILLTIIISSNSYSQNENDTLKYDLKNGYIFTYDELPNYGPLKGPVKEIIVSSDIKIPPIPSSSPFVLNMSKMKGDERLVIEPKDGNLYFFVKKAIEIKLNKHCLTRIYYYTTQSDYEINSSLTIEKDEDNCYRQVIITPYFTRNCKLIGYEVRYGSIQSGCYGSDFDSTSIIFQNYIKCKCQNENYISSQKQSKTKQGKKIFKESISIPNPDGSRTFIGKPALEKPRDLQKDDEREKHTPLIKGKK